MPPALDRLLPHLLALHARGTLVPFLGAGMSRDACPDWRTMIERLEQEAGTGPEEHAEEGTRADDATRLIRRADRAVLALRRRGGADPARTVAAALRRALYRDAAVEIPAQTIALAQLWWPLVLTTNYDSLYVAAARAYDEAHRTLRPREPRHAPAILDRSPRDIQRLLTSLDGYPTPTLWTLQGYLPHPSHEPSGRGAEDSPLIVGHAEYRRASHTLPRFRRAFAEVFRRRSFLFLGSGLAEPYFLELFDEVLEYFGPSPEPHFAFARRGDLDGRFLRARYNIELLEYPAHEDLVGWLDALAAGAREGRRVQVSWGWRWDRANGTLPLPDFGICRSALSAHLVTFSGGAIVVGARSAAQGRGVLAESFVEIGAALGARFAGEFPLPAPGARGVRRILPAMESGGAAIIAVLPPDAGAGEPLRGIADSVAEALDWAVEAGHDHIRMPLLSGGGEERVPPYFALVQMARGYRAWRAAHEERVRLTLHLVGEEAIHLVMSGRLDFQELLASEELRFWTEVVEGDGGISRELCYAPPETTLSALAARLALRPPGWEVETEPAPAPGLAPPGDWDRATLLDLGVVPGGTVRFVRQ